MKRIAVVLTIIIILLEVLILIKLNEKKDIGYHKPTDCMVINEEEIYCKISIAVDY